MNAKEQYMQLRAERKSLTTPVLDQIAVVVSNPAMAVMAMRSFGLEEAEWTEDIVVGHGKVHGKPLEHSKARLLFNYDLGIELEILQYLEGDNWHAHVTPGAFPRISHMGFHVNAGEMPDLPFPLVQELWTDEHSNPDIAGRSYHYRIYDTRLMNGGFTKYIARVK